MPIPCKCDGFVSEKCICSSLRKDSSDASVCTTQTSNVGRMLNHSGSYEHRAIYDIKEESNTNRVMKTFEEFYETCLGYNLRYCGITGGFVKHNGDYFKYMLKDVAVIICFLITNFVVFVAIASKTLVHILLLFFIIFQWIIRFEVTAMVICAIAVTSNLTLLPNRTTDQESFSWSSNSLQSRYQVQYLSAPPKADELKSSSIEQT